MHKRYFNIQSLLSNINQWIEISSKSIFTQRYFFSNENLLFEKECKQKSAVKGCIRITVLDAGAFVYLLMQSRVVPELWRSHVTHFVISAIGVPAKEKSERPNKTRNIFLFISCSWIVYYDKVN